MSFDVKIVGSDFFDEPGSSPELPASEPHPEFPRLKFRLSQTGDRKGDLARIKKLGYEGAVGPKGNYVVRKGPEEPWRPIEKRGILKSLTSPTELVRDIGDVIPELAEGFGGALAAAGTASVHYPPVAAVIAAGALGSGATEAARLALTTAFGLGPESKGEAAKSIGISTAAGLAGESLNQVAGAGFRALKGKIMPVGSPAEIASMSAGEAVHKATQKGLIPKITDYDPKDIVTLKQGRQISPHELSIAGNLAGKPSSTKPRLKPNDARSGTLPSDKDAIKDMILQRWAAEGPGAEWEIMFQPRQANSAGGLATVRKMHAVIKPDAIKYDELQKLSRKQLARTAVAWGSKLDLKTLLNWGKFQKPRLIKHLKTLGPPHKALPNKAVHPIPFLDDHYLFRFFDYGTRKNAREVPLDAILTIRDKPGGRVLYENGPAFEAASKLFVFARQSHLVKAGEAAAQSLDNLGDKLDKAGAIRHMFGLATAGAGGGVAAHFSPVTARRAAQILRADIRDIAGDLASALANAPTRKSQSLLSRAVQSPVKSHRRRSTIAIASSDPLTRLAMKREGVPVGDVTSADDGTRGVKRGQNPLLPARGLSELSLGGRR